MDKLDYFAILCYYIHDIVVRLLFALWEVE